jgi:hypothetical protein
MDEASNLDLSFLDFSHATPEKKTWARKGSIGDLMKSAPLSPRVKLAVSRSAKRSKHQTSGVTTIVGRGALYQTNAALSPQAVRIARKSLSQLFSPGASADYRAEASAPVSPKSLVRKAPREYSAVESPAKSDIYTSVSSSGNAQELLNPIPKSKGIIRCKLRRSRKQKEVTIWFQTDKDRYEFLMSARKKRMPGAASFTISSRMPEFYKDVRSHIGRVQADLFKEKYAVYEAPSPSKPKMQLGAIFFEVSEDCPRKTTMLIPELGVGGERKNWVARHKRDTLFESYANSKNIMDMQVYNNTLPHYDPKIDRFVLDLNCRATKASVKNTIVHREENKNRRCLWLFGKTGENEFNIDMAWPLSPIQGFAFAIATLHSKS